MGKLTEDKMREGFKELDELLNKYEINKMVEIIGFLELFKLAVYQEAIEQV